MDYLYLFTESHKRGINTCLDTSGVTFRPDDPEYLKKVDKLLEVTDLVMLDIKHINPEEHMKLCKQPNENILAFARYLDKTCSSSYYHRQREVSI